MQLPRGAGDLPPAAPSSSPVAAPAPVASSDARLPLDLAREWAFRGRTLDEAAIALVELSVLTYARLDEVASVFARSGFEVAAWSPGEDRRPDLEAARPVARGQPSMPLPPLPMGSPDPEVQKRVVQVLEAIKKGTPTSPATKRAQRQAAAERARRMRPARVLAFRDGANVVIAFRGTQGLADWGRDAMAWPAARMPLRHYGFARCWDEVRAPLLAWLAEQSRALGRPPTLYLGGHSLGGAMATLAAIDLAQADFPVARVVTIGCPRAGGRGLRRAYVAAAATPGPHAGRNLTDVSTRFVHGTDVFTSVLPPPPLAVHMCDGVELTADDRLQTEDFVPEGGLLNVYAVSTRVLGLPQAGYAPGLVVQPKPSALSTWRLAVTQVAAWISIYHPVGWVRFAPLVPAVAEQIRVMLLQHKSARYLKFFPHTALGWALQDVRAERAARHA